MTRTDAGLLAMLLTPPEPEAVTRMVISLGRRYVQYINRTYRRTGTLWDSRYKSSLVQADAYLPSLKDRTTTPTPEANCMAR